MRANQSIPSLIGPLLAIAMAAHPLHAVSNLLENSPFLPTNVGAGAAQESAVPLELRSIMKEGGDFEFSLYDPAKKLSTWARLNESGHDFMIKAYDPDKQVLTVEQKSRTYKLALKESKITLLAVAPGQPPMMAGMPPGSPQGVPQAGFPPQTGPFPMGGRGPIGPTPSLTPDQLRSLEADINRRRELRRQAAAAQSAGAVPSPTGQPQQR
jgi:hypothetical protein